jgi:hypothetical protein
MSTLFPPSPTPTAFPPLRRSRPALLLRLPPRALAVPTRRPPLRRREHVEPVVELETPQVDVAVEIVYREPDEHGAKEGGEDERDDEIGVHHDV